MSQKASHGAAAILTTLEATEDELHLFLQMFGILMLMSLTLFVLCNAPLRRCCRRLLRW
jgi:hypothetical protein